MDLSSEQAELVVVGSLVSAAIGAGLAHLSVGQAMLVDSFLLPFNFCVVAARRYLIRSGPEESEIPEVNIDL